MPSETWFSKIKNHPSVEGLLGEVQRTIFRGPLPAEASILKGGFVDMGFENIASPAEAEKIRIAFADKVVMLPGTNRCTRFVYPLSVVETVDASASREEIPAATLPTFWREGVLTYGDNSLPVWVGHRVPEDYKKMFDLTNYVDLREGLCPPHLAHEQRPRS